MTPCNHRIDGLCPACQADHDEDPSAWEEYGNHPQGQANWQALLDDIAAEAALMAQIGDDGFLTDDEVKADRAADDDLPF